MNRISLILILFANFLFAIDNAATIEVVKSNSIQLDTPQAQQKKISIEQVLKQIDNSDKNNKKIETQDNIKNNIDEKSTKSKNNIEVIKQNNTIINKPLEFISEKKLIKFIQSKRQISKTKSLKRFGEKFFYNKNTLNKKVLSVPEYYQINVGDKIIVQIFGGNDKTLNLTVNNNGNIFLPVIGPIYIAGLSVAEVKDLIQKKLMPTYTNSKIVVNVEVNSFIQVVLTGYVKAPGIYNLTSLSTVKDLLISANGFGQLGSMREVYLKRNGKVIKIIDFYKLIKDGKLVDTTFLRNGDIIYVPRAKILVYLNGAVSTPAIYEMKKNENLKDLITISGGLLPDASDDTIKVKRYIHNDYVKVMFVKLRDNFHFVNGDKIYVYKISELNQNYVKVYGNIEKPGTYGLPEDKKLATLLKRFSYLKNTYYKYGVIITFNNKIISFSLNHPGNIKLNKKDEIFIFNKYEILPLEYVTIKGNVVKSQGKYRWYKGITLRDIINNAGLSGVVNLKKVQVVSYNKKLRPILKYIDFTKNPNYKLQPFDEVTLFDYYNFNPLKHITIFGAVHKTGVFTYAKGMTLKDALTMSGWLQDKADKNYIELIRYKIINDKKTRSIKKLSLKDLDFKLKPYDELNIKIIPNWNKRQTMTIKGEVKYPGVYVIQTGDRLADIIERAGGFTKNAYLYASVFTRESVRKMQVKRLNQMIYKLKKKVAIFAANAKGVGEDSMNARDLIYAINSVAKQAKNLKPIGRIAIKLNKNLKKFKKSPYNLLLRNNDILYIPSQKDNVIVMGEVLTPTAFVYTTDSTLKYIKKAGGRDDLADNIYFVVHANGFTQKGEFGNWFDSDIKVKPGDAITVPIKIKTSTWFSVFKDITLILYRLAITNAALKTVGAF